MIVVDASVWVSTFVADDVHHAASREWLMALTRAGGSIAAPMILTAEVAGAIARRAADPQAGRAAVGQLLRMPGLHLMAVDTRLGRLATQAAADCRLPGVDSLYVAVAQRLQVPLVTWDSEQLNRTTSLIVTYTPDTAPTDVRA